MQCKRIDATNLETIYTRNKIIGTVLCIFSVMPLFGAMGLDAGDIVSCAAVCFMLFVIAIACLLFVYAGTINDSMQKLLEEEEYTRENKARSGTGCLSQRFSCLSALDRMEMQSPNITG